MQRNIYCPKCKRRLGTYDGKAETNKIIHCRDCNIRTVYDVKSRTTYISKIPPRATSSGKTFY